ncbi:MAG: DUF2058 family protein [Pseudomonadota bacterium]
MSNSLRDQLIKAGLVTQEQADKADADERQKRARKQGGGRRDGRRGESGSTESGRGRGKGKDGGAAPGQRSGRRAQAKNSGRGGDGGQRRGSRSGQRQKPVDDSPEAVKARAAAQARSRDERAVKALKQAVGGTEKALRDELRRFIAAYDQRAKEALESDQPYHFAHNQKIKRIHIPEAQIDALATGQLVVVNNDGRYALLPFGPACTIASVEPRRIVAAHVAPAADTDADTDAEIATGDVVAAATDGGIEQPPGPDAAVADELN